MQPAQMTADRAEAHRRRHARNAEDDAVWAIMSEHIGAAADQCPWLSPICRAGIMRWCEWEGVPTLDDINDWLEPTGWRATFVDGYLPVSEYQQLQSERIFPVSRDLRSLQHLEHSPWPDFVHDVIGHLPMMFDPDYSRLVQQWAERGLTARPTATDKLAANALTELTEARSRSVMRPGEVERLTDALVQAQNLVAAENSRFSRFATFYTWAIEFGSLCKDGEDPIWIGAAALSSPGEMRRLINGEVAFKPFKGHAVGHPIDYTRYQDLFFVAKDYDDYFEALVTI